MSEIELQSNPAFNQFQHVDNKNVKSSDNNEPATTVPKKKRKREKYIDEGDTEHSRPYTLCARVLIAGIAVFLIWLTTLNLATSIANGYFRAPATSQIFDLWQLTVDVTNSESKAYKNCAQRQINQCLSNLNATYFILAQKNQETRARNKEVVSLAQSQSRQCSEYFTEISTGVKKWQQSTFSNQLRFTNDLTKCSAAEKKKVTEMFASLNDVQSNAYLVNQEFISQVQNLGNQSYNSIANRTQYDKNYVLNKFPSINLQLDLYNLSFDPNIGRIPDMMNFLQFRPFGFFELLIGNLTACITGPKASCAIPMFDPVTLAYDKLQTQLNQTANDVARIVNRNFATAAYYMSQAMDSLSRGRRFISVIASVYGSIKSSLPSISFPSLPIGIEFPFTLLALPNLPPLPPLTQLTVYFRDAIKPAIDAMRDAIQTVFDAIKAALELFHFNINAKLPTINYFDDYNPPEMVLNTTKLTSLSTGFSTSSKTTLQLFSQLSAPVSTPTLSLNTSYNFELAKAAKIFDLRSSINFKIASFGGDMKFVPMIYALYALLLFFVVIDYIIRAIRSFKLASEFYAASAVYLPFVDIREKKDNSKGPASMWLATIITHPYTILGIISLIASVALIPLAGAYIPLYEDYQSGCVKGSNGTILTNNLESFVYNYASYDGNKETTIGLATFDKQRIADCTQSNAETLSENTENTGNYNSAKTGQNDTADKIDLVNRCVDFSNFPSEDVFIASYGVHNPAVSILLSQSSCFQPLPSAPQDATFNCSALPMCSVTCSGPQELLLASITYETGCRTEWMIHASLWRGFLAILIYICFNVSREMFVGALCRWNWRVLTPEGFTFSGTCSRTGKTTLDVKTKLKMRVSDTIRRFEDTAIIMFMISILIHLPYLVVMLYINYK